MKSFKELRTEELVTEGKEFNQLTMDIVVFYYKANKAWQVVPLKNELIAQR